MSECQPYAADDYDHNKVLIQKTFNTLTPTSDHNSLHHQYKIKQTSNKNKETF